MFSRQQGNVEILKSSSQLDFELAGAGTLGQNGTKHLVLGEFAGIAIMLDAAW